MKTNLEEIGKLHLVLALVFFGDLYQVSPEVGMISDGWIPQASWILHSFRQHSDVSRHQQQVAGILGREFQEKLPPFPIHNMFFKANPNLLIEKSSIFFKILHNLAR